LYAENQSKLHEKALIFEPFGHLGQILLFDQYAIPRRFDDEVIQFLVVHEQTQQRVVLFQFQGDILWLFL